MTNEPNYGNEDSVEQRLDRLERWTGAAEWKPTDGFDPIRFHQILSSYITPFSILFGVVFVAMFLLTMTLGERIAGASETSLIGLPMLVNGFSGGDYPITVLRIPVGILALNGIGLLSFGGIAFGVVAIGGLGIGVIAIGGGAVGLIAFGGGSLGIIAIGGGSVGYIAIGGGAYGHYVLAGDGKGDHVFSRRRQDEAAVAFFCKYLPRLRRAFEDQKTSTGS